MMFSIVIIALVITVGVLLVAAFRILGAVFGFIIDIYFDENPAIFYLILLCVGVPIYYLW